jgi:Ras-related C3 botulinum toxin substrate 1
MNFIKTESDERVELDLWDTNGSDDYLFYHLRPLSYPQADIFIASFSLVDPSSYERIRTKWVPEIRAHNPKTPIVLNGTKLDLRDDPEVLQNLKAIGLDPINSVMGEELKEKIGALSYHETSSKTQVGINELFIKVATIAARNFREVMGEGKKKDQCVTM